MSDVWQRMADEAAEQLNGLAGFTWRGLVYGNSPTFVGVRADLPGYEFRLVPSEQGVRYHTIEVRRYGRRYYSTSCPWFFAPGQAWNSPESVFESWLSYHLESFKSCLNK